METKRCELCGTEAAVYCDPDAAFLCWPCDAAVHGASFIVARHVRRVACAACCSVNTGFLVAGADAGPIRALCSSCDPDPKPCPSSSASTSSCISTAGSTATAAPRGKAASRPARLRRPRTESGRGVEGILAGWSRQMGLRSWKRRATEAEHLLGACRREIAALPTRPALAAALWTAVKFREASRAGFAHEAALLRRLQACSGVRARVVMVAASRIARDSRAAPVEKVEGWAESS